MEKQCKRTSGDCDLCKEKLPARHVHTEGWLNYHANRSEFLQEYSSSSGISSSLYLQGMVSMYYKRYKNEKERYTANRLSSTLAKAQVRQCCVPH